MTTDKVTEKMISDVIEAREKAAAAAHQAAINAARMCPDGSAHEYQYSDHVYRCTKCNTRTTKDEMRELTN